jgi:hypothetical protein
MRRRAVKTGLACEFGNAERNRKRNSLKQINFPTQPAWLTQKENERKRFDRTIQWRPASFQALRAPGVCLDCATPTDHLAITRATTTYNGLFFCFFRYLRTFRPPVRFHQSFGRRRAVKADARTALDMHVPTSPFTNLSTTLFSPFNDLIIYVHVASCTFIDKDLGYSKLEATTTCRRKKKSAR